MNNPISNICVRVDPTNPGQFFACCGLFELADRLWPGAEGWFTRDEFRLSCLGPMSTLLNSLQHVTLESSLGDEGIKRLGTLLSVGKSSLSPEDSREKLRLKAMWEKESLLLGCPFNLTINWWRDEHNNRTALKTWAAKQMIVEIARPLLDETLQLAKDGRGEEVVHRTLLGGTTLHFDSDNQAQASALDVGFSTYDLRRVMNTRRPSRPALELFSLIGLQRFGVPRSIDGSVFCFRTWMIPLPLVASAAVATGAVPLRSSLAFSFRLFNRTKYMKSFMPATPTGVFP